MLGASTGAAQVADPVAATRTALQRAKAETRRKPRPASISRDVYLRRPEILDVRLSPNGRHLSFIRRGGRGLDLILQNVASGAESRIAAGLQRAETSWSGDGHRLWLADESGLAVIETAGTLNAKRILKWNTLKKQRLWNVDARTPEHAMVHERVVKSGAEQHRYLLVDAQGKSRLLLETGMPVRSLLLNARGDLAFAAEIDGPRYETVIRQYTHGRSRDLLRCRALEECRLSGYSGAQQTLWLLSQHKEDKLSLRRWRANNRWETVHRDPVGIADADELLWSAARESWLAVAYHDGKRRWYGNDLESRKALAALAGVLPAANLRFSPTADGRLWLVSAQNAGSARDSYYLYRPVQKQLKPLFARNLAAKGMFNSGAQMQPISYRAPDGMLLHGYVLLPSGVVSSKAPLIAWIHGGPITRVYDRYDPAMQLLVNRGYTVFVPNFRASTGYGLNYVLSAKGDVGNGRVLSDIVAGLDFLLAEGIGNRDSQAVMGMSFGGYASLLALSHHPARFRFAFAGAPPTEYGWIKQWQADNDSESLRAEGAPLSFLFPQLGFRFKDAEWRQKMRRESPLAAVGSLKAPVYIWAGARDNRVPLKSIVHYVAEARRVGKPLSLLIDPDAGHTPGTTLGAEAWLYQIEDAANRHFGGGVSPASPELKAFLKRNVRINTD